MNGAGVNWFNHQAFSFRVIRVFRQLKNVRHPRTSSCLSATTTSPARSIPARFSAGINKAIRGRAWLENNSSASRKRRTASALNGPRSVNDWHFLRQFLQTDLDLAVVLKSFPDDEPMRAAVASCRGLRLLRQDPWECLASFILSSTKQIVQIGRLVRLLCETVW